MSITVNCKEKKKKNYSKMAPKQQADRPPQHKTNNTFPVAKAMMQMGGWDYQTVRALCAAGVVHHMERILVLAFTATQPPMNQ